MRTSASAAPARTSSAAAYSRVQSCCAALGSEAAKGGLTANKYKSATAICNQIAVKVKAGSVNESAALTLIRAQVQGVKIPGAC